MSGANTAAIESVKTDTCVDAISRVDASANEVVNIEFASVPRDILRFKHSPMIGKSVVDSSLSPAFELFAHMV